MTVPALPDGVVIRDATPSDAAALEPVMRLADPGNPDGSWRQLPTAIRQSLDADKYTRVRAVQETESGALVGGTMAPPAAWAETFYTSMGVPVVLMDSAGGVDGDDDAGSARRGGPGAAEVQGRSVRGDPP
ncbi:hypothetical protein ACWEWI_25780 [Streptomyces sp. NPDC003753]